MHWKSVFVGAAITAAAFVTAGRVFSGDEPGGDADAASAAPGAEHEALKQYVGEWEGTGAIPTPNGDLAVTMRQSGRMILGGRFLEIDSKVSAGASTMEMIEFVGYDPALKKYVHAAMEDDSSRISHDTGERDAAKKAFVMSGVEDLGGGREKKFHYTIGEVVDGSFRVAYFEDGAGGEKKLVEMTMKKR